MASSSHQREAAVGIILMLIRGTVGVLLPRGWGAQSWGCRMNSHHEGMHALLLDLCCALWIHGQEPLPSVLSGLFASCYCRLTFLPSQIASPNIEMVEKPPPGRQLADFLAGFGARPSLIGEELWDRGSLDPYESTSRAGWLLSYGSRVAPHVGRRQDSDQRLGQ